jgi:integrase
MVLERSEYPEGFPQQFPLAYVPESKELVLEYELPSPEIIPPAPDFRYVKARDLIEERPRKAAVIRERYQDIVALHDLRHTFASYLAMGGFNLRTIQQLLGHRDLRMTSRYAHLSADHLQQAVNSLDTILGHSPNRGIAQPGA